MENIKDIDNKEIDTFSSFIRSFIRYKKSYDGPNDDPIDEVNRKLTMKELRTRLGVPDAIFKRRLDKSRPIKSRDYIIAICTQLQLDVLDTNYALYLYGMPTLYLGNKSDIEKPLQIYYERDYELIEILEEYCDKEEHISIDDINKRLILKNFKELDICDRKNKKEYDFRFKTKNLKTETSFEYSFFNPYNSLSTQYDMSMYNCSTSMLLYDEVTKKSLAIMLDTNNKAKFYDLDFSKSLPKYTFSNYKDINDFFDYNLIINKTNNIDDFHSTNKMKQTTNKNKFITEYFGEKSIMEEYYSLLDQENKKELKRLFNQLDDTKNYNKRISAKFLEDDIYFFVETFNYYIPELNHYFFVEFYHGKWKYYILKNSIFMYKKLGEEEYKKYKKNLKVEYEFEGDSIEQIILFYKNKKHDYSFEYMTKKAKRIFEQLENDIKDLIEKLKNKSVFIYDSSSCFMSDEINLDYHICKFFGVEDRFEFYKKENEDIIYTAKYYTQKFIYKDGAIVLSIDDFRKAFEYGIENLEQILDVKFKYGSIESLLEK